jgi:hypothetical protein
MESEKDEVKPANKKRLKTLKDVRVYLADLINETRTGKVDSNLAGKIGFLLNILRGTIADSELEERLSKLEKEIMKNGHNGKEIK